MKVKQAVYVYHWANGSNHQELMKTPQHLYWHQKVGHTNWPEYWAATTPAEDKRHLLAGNGLRTLDGNGGVLPAPRYRPRRESRIRR